MTLKVNRYQLTITRNDKVIRHDEHLVQFETVGCADADSEALELFIKRLKQSIAAMRHHQRRKDHK